VTPVTGFRPPRAVPVSSPVRTALVANFGTGVGSWIYDSGGEQYPEDWHRLTDSLPDSSITW